MLSLIIDGDGLIRGAATGTIGLAPGERLSAPPPGFDPSQHVGRARLVDGALVLPAPEPPSPDALAALIKRECARRILAVLKDLATQANINSYLLDLTMIVAQGGQLSAQQSADVALSRAIKGWVVDMQDAARALAELDDATYADDAHWPAPPAGGRAFADRF